MCDALYYLLDNIFIRFGSKVYRQIVGIQMGTNCAPLVAYLFLFCYETSFVDHLCYLCLVFVMLSRLFITALWSPAGKGLTSWL